MASDAERAAEAGKGGLIIIERLLFVMALILTTPLMILWFALPLILGILIGAPIAGIKFALTGSSGIGWYLHVFMGFFEDHWPMFAWEDSLKRRKRERP